MESRTKSGFASIQRKLQYECKKFNDVEVVLDKLSESGELKKMYHLFHSILTSEFEDTKKNIDMILSQRNENTNFKFSLQHNGSVFKKSMQAISNEISFPSKSNPVDSIYNEIYLRDSTKNKSEPSFISKNTEESIVRSKEETKKKSSCVQYGQISKKSSFISKKANNGELKTNNEKLVGKRFPSKKHEESFAGSKGGDGSFMSSGSQSQMKLDMQSSHMSSSSSFSRSSRFTSTHNTNPNVGPASYSPHLAKDKVGTNSPKASFGFGKKKSWIEEETRKRSHSPGPGANSPSYHYVSRRNVNAYK